MQVFEIILSELPIDTQTASNENEALLRYFERKNIYPNRKHFYSAKFLKKIEDI